MFKQRKKHSQSGMTLIELLVSLSMVGALIVLYAAAFNMAVLSKHFRNENLAYHVASKKIEELRSTPFDSLPTSAAFTDSQLDALPAASGNFTINDYSTYTGLKELVVTITWNDGRSRNMVLKTLAGSGGINE